MKLTYSLLLLLTISVVTTAVFVRRNLPTVDSQPSDALVQDTRGRVEAELVTIQPYGFEPAEISRPKGRFLLGIDNRSGLEQIQLRLELANGTRMPALESRNRRLSWREEVDFPPGQYVIRELNHPQWSCLMTITER